MLMNGREGLCAYKRCQQREEIRGGVVDGGAHRNKLLVPGVGGRIKNVTVDETCVRPVSRSQQGSHDDEGGAVHEADTDFWNGKEIVEEVFRGWSHFLNAFIIETG